MQYVLGRKLMVGETASWPRSGIDWRANRWRVWQEKIDKIQWPLSITAVPRGGPAKW